MAITTNRDKVRLMIGDTDSTDPLLQDDEIAYFLTERTVLDNDGGTVSVNLQAAAADAAGAIAAEFSRKFNFSTDGQTFDLAQRVGHYLSLERELRNRAGAYAVSVGGTVTY